MKMKRKEGAPWRELKELPWKWDAALDSLIQALRREGFRLRSKWEIRSGRASGDGRFHRCVLLRASYPAETQGGDAVPCSAMLLESAEGLVRVELSKAGRRAIDGAPELARLECETDERLRRVMREVECSTAFSAI